MYKDPTKIAQVYSKYPKEYQPLHINHYEVKAVGDERVVVKDLLNSFRHLPGAIGIAAPQRGHIGHTIFVTAFGPDTMSDYPVMELLPPNSLPKYRDVHVFKDVNLEIPGDVNTVASAESCLSFEGHERVVTRYYFALMTAKMLDMKAYRRNKNNLVWREVVIPLKGLGSQVVQHEMDHCLGRGIWSYDR